MSVVHKLAFLTLLTTAPWSAPLQDGPTGGSGAQVLPDAQTPDEKRKNDLALEQNFHNVVLMKPQACDYSTWMGDLVVDCKVPLGVQADPHHAPRIDALILLRCGAEVMRAVPSRPSFNAKEQRFREVGMSFDYDGIRIKSDSAMKEWMAKNHWRKPTLCGQSDFRIEIVPYAFSYRRTGPSGNANYSHNALAHGINRLNPNGAIYSELTISLLQGYASHLARKCDSKLSSGQCRSAMDEYQKMLDSVNIDKLREYYEQASQSPSLSCPKDSIGNCLPMVPDGFCKSNPADPRCWLKKLDGNNGVRG